MMYNITNFLEDELNEYNNTERDVFGLILKDCVVGIDAIRETNKNPTIENFAKEEEVLKEIICR